MYRLAKDDVGRTYVIPVDKSEQFTRWAFYYKGDRPDWAMSVESHCSVVFPSFEVR